MTMFMNKLKTVTLMLVVLAMIAFGGGWVLTRDTAKADQGQAVVEPPPAAKAKQTETVFVIKPKLFQVNPVSNLRGYTDWGPIIASEDHGVYLDFNTGTAGLFPKVADACADVKLGTRLEIKVKRVNAGKVQIYVAFSDGKVDKDEKADTLIVGRSAWAVKHVELGKLSTIVLLQYSEGKPQLWLELLVSEAEAERLPLPLPGGTAPVTTPRK
jgi:hypothetical protein